MIWVWTGIIIISLVMEFITFEMVAIWFAGGGLLALILAICGTSWEWQLIGFSILSLILIFALRKLCLKALNKTQGKSNLDEIVGKRVHVVEAIEAGEDGTVKVNGIVWNAEFENDDDRAAEKEKVEIVKVKSTKLIVKKIQENVEKENK